MKKITAIVLVAITLFFSGLFVEGVFAECYFSNGDLSSDLKSCQPSVNVITGGDYKVTWGARERVIALANRLIEVGAILSVGAIAYAGFIYTTTMGDDEQIKKGKTALKFGIIGFLVMLIAFPLVNAIVNFVYSIG